MKTKFNVLVIFGVLAVQVSAQTMEFTGDMIKNFPEKVRFQEGWMDVTFQQLDSYAAGNSDVGSLADVRLGFDVIDKNNQLIDYCYVPKQLDNSSMPNPFVQVIQNLKQGDKIRLFGKILGGFDNDPSFRIEKIESLENVATHVSPPLTPEQIAARAAVEKAALQKSFHTTWQMATNGSASAQCSLGLRYLNGRGCETNRAQAIYWLQQSAMQGDSEASNTLAKISSVSTNAASAGNKAN
jgi:hypothetical protein